MSPTDSAADHPLPDPAAPDPEKILQLIHGAWRSAILGAAAVHGVFGHLEGAGGTVDEVARGAEISPRGAQSLLDGLVAMGLAEVRDGRYSNSPEASAFLVAGKPFCLAPLARVQAATMDEWVHLPEVVKQGRPLSSTPAHLPDNPFWQELVPAIAPLAVPVARRAAEHLGLATAGPIRWLDVGGGSGVYSETWLEINPQAEAFQLDWPSVNALARRRLEARGLGERFHTIDGDFHEIDLGSERFDVIVFSQIAHQESPASDRALFRAFRAALEPGGTLVVSDFVVDDDRSGPPFPLVFQSNMLLMTEEGGTWRASELRGWLTEAGFTEVELAETPTPASLLFAR